MAFEPAPPSAAPVWDDGTWPPLPALAGEVAADVCVVGLDAASVADGTAGRNGGFLLAGLAAFYHDAVRALGRERARAVYCLTVREIDRIAAETPDAVRRVGSLRLAADAAEEADCAAQYEAMCADGLPVRPYDGPAGRGLFVPTDGAFQPGACARVGTRAPVTHRWAAVVGYTRDPLPVAREVRPRVWAVGGYSGTGNVLGALLGRAVAERVVTGASALLDPFVV